MRFFTILILLLPIFNCTLIRDEEITSKLIIKESRGGVIANVENPTVDYTLEKDGEVFLTVDDFPLIDKGGYYTIDLTLVNQGSYRFSEFNIKGSGEILYIVDRNHQSYLNGFIPSPEIDLYLLSIYDPDFDMLEVTQEDVTINLNETGSIGYIDLTFKVSSNIPDAIFNIYMYSIYWKLGGSLGNNEIFDMDTGAQHNILEEGDGVPWGKGQFKIVTTNSKGESVFLIGSAEEWNKKHIKLIF